MKTTSKWMTFQGHLPPPHPPPFAKHNLKWKTTKQIPSCFLKTHKFLPQNIEENRSMFCR
jgi:hypothetical protein